MPLISLFFGKGKNEDTAKYMWTFIINFQLMSKTIKKISVMIFLALILFTFDALAQTNSLSADQAAIKQTALDYMEGWYAGDADRMGRSLHPELAKRIVRTNSKGQSQIDQISAMTLVGYTKAGGGKNTPKEQQQKDVIILDVFENVASIKVIMSGWIDYMQMARWNNKWVIVNVLWELKPQKK